MKPIRTWAVIRIRLIACALVLAALGTFLWIFFSPSEREPVYQGKTLHDWLSAFWPGRNPTPEKQEQGKFAVRQIGTNALPTLLRWISAQDAPFKRKVVTWIHDHPWVPIRFETAVDKNMLATRGFWILGKSQASSAVPALVEIVKTGGGERTGLNNVTFPMLALANLDHEASIKAGIQFGTNRWSGTNVTVMGWSAPPATGSPDRLAARADGAATREAAKQWLRNAKYGVFITFLGGGTNWNATVNAFDVKTFVRQMEQAGVGYVLFTLGQNSGYYCAPNATYDRFGGFKPGERCSFRDLPLDLAKELNKRNIKLFLYSTARAPQDDKQARAGLAEIDDIIKSPATQEFSRRWWAVLREWSERYGVRVAGWWFDGAYTTTGWDDPAQPCNWHTWAEAARAGNPGRLLAWNKGTGLADAFGALSDEQDYTAGERNGFDVTPHEVPGPTNLVWQLLGYMGDDWGKTGGPKKTDADMIDFIRRINERNGVVTIDVHVENGRVHEPHLKQLIAIRRATRSPAKN